MRTTAMLIILSVFLGASTAWALDPSDVDRKFQEWLKVEIWPLARRAGISRAQFDRQTGALKPDLDLPGIDLSRMEGAKGDADADRARMQAEFSSAGRYFRESTISGIVRVGQSKQRSLRHILDKIEDRFGVPGRILLSIWGRESGFGSVKSRRNTFEVLATRAFFGPNQKYFSGELIAAMEIAGPDATLPGSWAGALGQPQMMPTSFLAYGADGNGDGKIDIWGSEADTLASIARFLAEHEWQAGRDWGYEISLPADVSCTLEGPDQARPFQDWIDLGVKRISGRPFPDNELERNGFLVLPAGRSGPAFLATDNFSVLKNYNRSDAYALFVGNVADRIAYGSGAFRAGWPRATGLKRGDIARIQTALEKRGLDTGGADGLAGNKTRRAIGSWEKTAGLRETCFPSKSVLSKL